MEGVAGLLCLDWFTSYLVPGVAEVGGVSRSIGDSRGICEMIRYMGRWKSDVWLEVYVEFEFERQLGTSDPAVVAVHTARSQCRGKLWTASAHLWFR
jgi:hypothetical protein